MPIDVKLLKTPIAREAAANEVSLTAKIMNILNRDMQIGRRGINDKKKENFYSELSILMSSGVDIRTSLDIIISEQKAEKEKVVFEQIKSDITGGSGLAEAINKTGKFSTYEYYSLRIGEESGRLKDVMTDLSLYFSRKIKQKRQLTSALTYPLLIITTAVIAVIFMLNFIVPMFVDVFARFNGNMPALTMKIIASSDFIKSYFGYFIIGLIFLGIALYSVRNTEYFRSWSTRILLKLPLFGEIIRKIYLARFCQSMALLLGARTPMLRTLNLVRNMISFYSFEKALEVMESDVLHGKLLHQSMEQFNLFDSRVLSLVKVAEEVNQLDQVFSRLNSQLSDDLEHRIGMLSSLLEPIMIVIVGGLVSVILISMYLPLFQLGTSIY